MFDNCSDGTKFLILSVFILVLSVGAIWGSYLAIYEVLKVFAPDLLDETAVAAVEDENDNVLHDLFLEISGAPAASGQDGGLEMASAFATMAELEGYQARVITSSIVGRDGELQDHSWVLVTRNGKEYIYDPAANARFGGQGSFFNVDPLDPPIRYIYPDGQEPLGGYKDFGMEAQDDSEWREFAAFAS